MNHPENPRDKEVHSDVSKNEDLGAWKEDQGQLTDMSKVYFLPKLGQTTPSSIASKLRSIKTADPGDERDLTSIAMWVEVTAESRNIDRSSLVVNLKRLGVSDKNALEMARVALQCAPGEENFETTILDNLAIDLEGLKTDLAKEGKIWMLRKISDMEKKVEGYKAKFHPEH